MLIMILLISAPTLETDDPSHYFSNLEQRGLTALKYNTVHTLMD